MQTKIRGYELYYDVIGEGEPLLCIHGFPLSGVMWQPLCDSLGDRYQLIVPDLRGHGRSEASESVTMADFADDLASVLDAIGISKPVTVIGLSMGGYVAFEFYRRHGDRAGAMVLVDTQASKDDEERVRIRHETAEKVLQRGSGVVADGMIDKLFAPEAPEDLKSRWHEVMSATSPQGVAAALGAMAGRPDSFDTLRGMDVPTLIVVGEHDVITPIDCAREMHQASHSAQLEVVPRAGHMVPLEAPQAFAELVEAFLSER